MMLGGVSSSVALEHPREILTLSDLIGRLRRSAALRDRFADNPRAVFLEFGIDPSPHTFCAGVDTNRTANGARAARAAGRGLRPASPTVTGP